MSEELYDDPVKGIALCNKHIQKLEKMIEDAREADDLKLASTTEWHLAKWVDLLQHFITAKHQQGYDSEDITIGLNKGKKHQFKA